jgi:hypothetical protein
VESTWEEGARLRTKICCNLLFFPSHFFQNPLNIIIEGGKFKTTTDSLMPNPSRLKPSSACPRAQPPSSSRCIALLSGRLPAITLASLSLSLWHKPRPPSASVPAAAWSPCLEGDDLVDILGAQGCHQECPGHRRGTNCHGL